MSTKREDERNEKVIRGLMKLPPNRRCINCNNLGPQYVCTNFWTFVCITCSGIHREFTHRVKSVSMAKFTSQEVEALQKGGNQRARETYLVHWDPQRQKQPNSSNAEKVREFIKHVYVDKKYAGNKTSDKPPTGTQNLRHPEEETRRASSYHSYSQSPPYDYQYEERRYGRQLPVLTRKPGSDRGLYEGKVSNFSSPSRFSDQTLEHPRASDYSVSSPGQSPNFQRDGRVRSPPYQTTDNTSKENSERVRRTQRATSSGSFGSFDSNSLSFKSSNSVTLADLVSAPDQSSEIIQDIQYKQSAEGIQDKQYASSSLPPSSTSTNFGGLDLFDTPFAPQNVTPSPTVDLFHLPEAQPKAPIDLFEPSSTSSVPNIHAQKPPETTPSSLNFFSQMPQQSPPVTMGKILSEEVVPKNEGWAMFDFPQQVTPNPSVVHNAHEPTPIHDLANEPISIHNLWHGEPYNAQVSFTSTQVNEGLNAHEPTSMHNLWHGEPYESQVSFTTNQQPWDAFEDPNRQFPYNTTHQNGQEVAGQAPFTTVDQHLGDFNQAGFERVVLDSKPPITNTIPFHVEAHTHVIERKSSNPFDLSDDCDFESSSTYLNMNSLQAALPSGQLPNSFVDDVNQSWFAHNPAAHYIPTAQQAAIGYMGGPAPSVQMTNVPNQEPVAPVGGNPFA